MSKAITVVTIKGGAALKREITLAGMMLERLERQLEKVNKVRLTVTVDTIKDKKRGTQDKR